MYSWYGGAKLKLWHFCTASHSALRFTARYRPNLFSKRILSNKSSHLHDKISFCQSFIGLRRRKSEFSPWLSRKAWLSKTTLILRKQVRSNGFFKTLKTLRGGLNVCKIRLVPSFNNSAKQKVCSEGRQSALDGCLKAHGRKWMI